jgi:phosphohistidine swiveling domain-containing protein
MALVLDAAACRGRADVGGKAAALAELVADGHAVPAFVAVPTDVVAAALAGAVSWEAIGAACAGAVSAATYAVRSSGVAEDGAVHSMAGAFTTKLRVPSEHLAQALAEVASHGVSVAAEASAQAGTVHGAAGFAMVVQSFVEPEVSGVACTRDPAGGREMVIEYVAGHNEDVVSGRVTPTCLRVFWTEPVPTRPTWLAALIAALRRIESARGFPQDVEWCVVGGKLMVLQSRPITSLTSAQWASVRQLDETLPVTPFVWEKTALTETVPRPVPVMMELLQRIYAAGGPVALAYADIGVRYTPTTFLRIVGNELYVDREQELGSVYPAHTLLASGPSLQPRPARARGLWTSLRNAAALSQLAGCLPECGAHVVVMQATLDALSALPNDFEGALSMFLAAYRVAFLTNLYAAAAANKEVRGGTYTVTLPASAATWQGNGLDIADTSAFTPAFGAPGTAVDATGWDALRECSRWIAVAGANALRMRCAAAAWHTGSTDEVPALPVRLTHIAALLPAPGAAVGVSGGVATGVAVDVAGLAGVQNAAVLCVPALTPDLAPLLGRVVAVVADRGGMLSHLAIVARERCVPVVVGARVRLGDTVTVDGGAGTVHLTRG